MVRRRTGASTPGCLLTLLVISVVVYFGAHAADIYWRSFEYKDAMQQEVRFRGHLPDHEIRKHMTLIADSLGLPPEAGDVYVVRTNDEIAIESSYYETLMLPGFQRDIHFDLRASRPVNYR